LKTTIRDLSNNPASEATSQPASAQKRLKIIGNIPYYITSDILFWAFGEWATLLSASESASNQPLLDRAVIMMQKEVAERIVAKQRTKDYGILSVASMLVSEPKVLFHVSPSCFFPPPKVTSSVVEFRLKPSAEAASAFLQTQPLVRAAFNQRRKMLSNALHGTLSQIAAKRTDITPASIIALAEERGLSYFRKRAEELTPQDFITLAAFLREI
jgi:16S rRNA (adenine1518-N6/adenine1519-N6)-dimethyltransferase